MQSVRALLSVVLALALAVSTSQSVLSMESVRPCASDMVIHDMGIHSAMPGTCHKCVHKAPCCALCVSTAILTVTSHVVRVSMQPGVALLTEPQFKNSTIRPNPPPPKLGDLT